MAPWAVSSVLTEPQIDSPLVTVTDVHHPGKAEGKGPSRVPRGAAGIHSCSAFDGCSLVPEMPSCVSMSLLQLSLSLPKSQIPEDTASNMVNHHRSCHDRAKAA